MAIEINTDMGEGYGALLYGDDEGLAPHVHSVNIACGFHGGDPSTIARTVDLAARHGLVIGAHPSLPDRSGFGRREMAVTRDEVRDLFIYQIGALKGFVEARGLRLSHVKPHGKIYSMTGRDAALAEGAVDAAEAFGITLICIAGHKTEDAARRRGVACKTELYVDLACTDELTLVVDKSKPVDVDWVARRSVRALREGVIDTVTGGSAPVRFEMLGVHNDMPNAAAVAAAVRRATDAEG